VSYCTVTEALSLLPTLGTLRDAATGVTATVPSATQGAAMLTATDAEINAHLIDKGHELPVTGAEALAYLKAVAMTGTAARIAKAKWPADSGPGGDSGAASALRGDYTAMLAFIDGGGLSVASSDVVGSSVAHGFRDSEGTALSGSTLVAPFSRETEF